MSRPLGPSSLHRVYESVRATEGMDHGPGNGFQRHQPVSPFRAPPARDQTPSQFVVRPVSLGVAGQLVPGEILAADQVAATPHGGLG
jgi:hypothetical protein